eukprot:scaffold1949_cov54-Cyclotella_meneghiniana.AAC.5
MPKQIDHTGLSPSCAIDLCSSQSSQGSAITPHAPPRQPANITTVAPAAPAYDQSNVDDKQALPSTRLFTDPDGYGYAAKDSGSVDVDDDDDDEVGGSNNDDDDEVNGASNDDDDEVGGVNGASNYDDDDEVLGGVDNRFQSIPYQGGVKNSFVDNVNKIIAWVNNTCPSNPRMPRKAKDSSEEEWSVYYTIKNMRRQKKNKNQVEEYLVASLPIDIFAQGNEARWNANFTKLQQFQVTNGHLNVDQYDAVLDPLYRWMKLQMNNFDSLDDTKKSLLQSLHSWEERRDMFLNRVAARNEFKETDLSEHEKRDIRRRQKLRERTKLLYQQAMERVFYDPSVAQNTTPSLYFKICDSNILDKSEEARAIEEYENDSSVNLNRTDFTKEDFNELKTDPDFVLLAHFSMRSIDDFQPYEGRLMHISYESQSLENQRKLYHNHDGDTSKVWASADSEFTPPFAARHWTVQAKRWIESAPIVGSKRQVVGDLLCYFPGSEDFYSFSQTKVSNQYQRDTFIGKNCRLLASCPDPTSPSAVLRCTWELPLSFTDFKPEMVALSKTTNKKWVRIDDDFETVVDLPFEAPNLVSMCSGVFTREYFHAVVLPKLGSTSASNAPNATLRSNKTTSTLKTNSKQQSSKKNHLKQTTLSFAVKSTSAPESEQKLGLDDGSIKRRIKQAWDEVKQEYSEGTIMVFQTYLGKRYTTELISPLELDIDSHQSVLREWVLSREGEAGTFPKFLVKVKSTENEGIPREGELYCFIATDLVKSFAPKNVDNDDSEEDDKVATSSKMSTTKRPVACDDAPSDDDVVFVGTSQAQSGHASSRTTRVVANKGKV